MSVKWKPPTKACPVVEYKSFRRWKESKEYGELSKRKEVKNGR